MSIDTVHSSFRMSRGGSLCESSSFNTLAALAAPCRVRFPFFSSFATLRQQSLALFRRSFCTLHENELGASFSRIHCQHISRFRSFVRVSFIPYLFMCRINFVICFSRLRPSHDNIATRYRCARRGAPSAVKVFMWSTSMRLFALLNLSIRLIEER